MMRGIAFASMAGWVHGGRVGEIAIGINFIESSSKLKLNKSRFVELERKRH